MIHITDKGIRMSLLGYRTDATSYYFIRVLHVIGNALFGYLYLHGQWSETTRFVVLTDIPCRGVPPIIREHTASLHDKLKAVALGVGYGWRNLTVANLPRITK